MEGVKTQAPLNVRELGAKELIQIKIGGIEKIVDARLVAGTRDAEFSGVSINSKKIEEGSLFIAIKGERKNGHQFIEEAVENGASALILSEREDEAAGLGVVAVLKVADTLRALRNIAAFIRRQRDIPVIGVTGSNGKSTAKEMAASVIGTRFCVLKNQGNFNNHIGLPLTLSGLGPEHDAAVLEMGMSGLGEIRLLCEIARPGYGIVTNVGRVHLEQLGSIENVAKAKRELIDSLNADGVAVLNRDDPYFGFLKKGAMARTVSFGLEEGADYTANDMATGETKTDFTLLIQGREAARINLNVPGTHNVYNALCACAVGDLMGIGPEGLKNGLASYEPLPMRMETIKWKGACLINDAYNANPESMEVAIDLLSKRRVSGRKIMVAGDMLELGGLSDSAHSRIGELASDKRFDFLVTFGERAKISGAAAVENGMDPSRVRSFSDPDETGDFLKGLMEEGDCLLFKGSRGGRMETIIERIKGN